MADGNQTRELSVIGTDCMYMYISRCKFNCGTLASVTTAPNVFYIPSACSLINIFDYTD